jgi:Fe-S cluster biogenesis protein NfuA
LALRDVYGNGREFNNPVYHLKKFKLPIMFIQTESTPNPNSLKFIPGQPVMADGTADFREAAKAKQSPLANRLFRIDGVVGVYLGGDFITVTKQDGDDWLLLKPAIIGAIMDHYSSGDVAVAADSAATATAGEAAEDSDLVTQIKEVLDSRVRPAVAMDGGDIIFDRFEDGIVYLYLQGACSGCPSSSATLKNGIENMLRYYVPEVEEVRASNQ